MKRHPGARRRSRASTTTSSSLARGLQRAAAGAAPERAARGRGRVRRAVLRPHRSDHFRREEEVVFPALRAPRRPDGARRADPARAHGAARPRPRAAAPRSRPARSGRRRSPRSGRSCTTTSGSRSASCSRRSSGSCPTPSSRRSREGPRPAALRRGLRARPRRARGRGDPLLRGGARARPRRIRCAGRRCSGSARPTATSSGTPTRSRSCGTRRPSTRTTRRSQVFLVARALERRPRARGDAGARPASRSRPPTCAATAGQRDARSTSSTRGGARCRVAIRPHGPAGGPARTGSEAVRPAPLAAPTRDSARGSEPQTPGPRSISIRTPHSPAAGRHAREAAATAATSRRLVAQSHKRSRTAAPTIRPARLGRQRRHEGAAATSRQRSWLRATSGWGHPGGATASTDPDVGDRRRAPRSGEVRGRPDRAPSGDQADKSLVPDLSKLCRDVRVR